ncbi:MAG: tetratricopeptide repeat protein [Meiothermus sp.]|nr:tetratricopeptide repeat protein [Meiothermus sp.]
MPARVSQISTTEASGGKLTPVASNPEVSVHDWVGELGIQVDLAQARLAHFPGQALELAEQAHARAEEQGLTGMQVRAGYIWAKALQRLGRVAEAVEITASSWHEVSQGDEPKLWLEGCRLLAMLAREKGDFALATSCIEQALRFARAEGQTRLEADLLNQQAGILNAKAEPLKALAALNTALEIVTQTGEVAAQASFLSNIGVLLTETGDYSGALDRFLAAYQIYQQPGQNQRNRAVNLACIGNLYAELEDFTYANQYFDHALQIARQTEEHAVEIQVLELKAKAKLIEGRPREAQNLYGYVLQLCRQNGLEATQAQAMEGLARTHHALGEFDQAAKIRQKALEMARAHGWRQTELTSLLGLGQDHLALQDKDFALQWATKALELAQQADRKKTLFEVHRLLSQIYKQKGDLARSIEHLEEYHRLEREVFKAESERQRQILSARLDLERVRSEAETLKLKNDIERQARERAEAEVERRTTELEKARQEMVSRLALAAEYRDDITGEHTYRVGRNAALIARELGWKPEEIELLRLAARLHDVGKIGIPDSILLKPGKLSPEETQQMKLHTQIGARILSGGQSRLLMMAEEIALNHHERWDGGGYPNFIFKDHIPLSARIVAVADVLDALTHDRPYKVAWTVREALEEIYSMSGTAFDPAVVEACLRVFGEARGDMEAHMQRLDEELSEMLRLEKSRFA